ncbi:hypothetical protein MHEI_29840 [Mycobacterium heidelbergense]|nr:hypothetical protein MHEI_29840 [Mycobacterium heidelbergense]
MVFDMLPRMRAPRLAALAGVLAMIIWSAPCADADPTSGDGPVIDSPTLSLSDLGAPTAIWFGFYGHRNNTVNTLTFPVPRGLSPSTLNATVEVPVNLRFGNLTVSQGDRTISRLELPTKDQTQMVIPLAGAQVVADVVTVTLTVTAIPVEGYCWDNIAPVRLVNGSVTFAGAEVAPVNVGGFLPPVIRKLTIALPPKPSRQESDAAVQLAAAMERRYGPQSPEVVVVPLADRTTNWVGPSLPLERQIIIKEGPDKGLSLQGNTGVPGLLISGPGDELTNQTRLLTDDLLRFAVSPAAVVAAPLPNKQKFVGDTTTLAQLNQSGLVSEGLWPEVLINLDQTRFGTALDQLRVHLIGSHTPLPKTLGGEVIATVNGETIDRWPVETDGKIDHSIEISRRLVTRVTSLRVTVRTSGDVGHCGDYLPVALTIDGRTQIQASRATPAVSRGFETLPQALMPRVQIGISDDDAFNDTVRAVQIMMGLQHMSAVPLESTVTSLKQAIDSRDPAILISAGAWPVHTIALPFTADQDHVTVEGLDTAGKHVSLTLNPAAHFGSLQTAFDGQRSILVATSNGSPAQLDELLRWLSAKAERWFGLTGRMIVSAPGAEPITIPNPPNDLAAQPATSNNRQNYAWAWWIAGAWLVAAAAGAVVILVRARRRRADRG